MDLESSLSLDSSLVFDETTEFDIDSFLAPNSYQSYEEPQTPPSLSNDETVYSSPVSSPKQDNPNSTGSLCSTFYGAELAADLNFENSRNLFVPQDFENKSIRGNVKKDPIKQEKLFICGKEYEQYVELLTTQRELTQREKNELKRQRRLIKNRESAQASRQRKKSFLEDLEKKVHSLKMENDSLKEKIAELKNEKEQLKKEVASKNFDSRALDLQQILQSNDLKSFFAFGWFFKNLMYHHDSVKAMLELKRQSEAISAKNMFVLGDIPSQEIDRRRLAIKPENPDRMVTRSTKRKRGENLSQQKKIKTRKISQTNQQNINFLGGNPKITNWKPNTTYLMCSNVCQISPPSDVQNFGNSPQMISFLIPPDSLGSSEEISQGTPSVLEVTCSVSDINFLPLQPNSPRIKKK